ncbi:MAG TPA: type II CAAX endopeptidase family protein [Planctomycetota bacterium]|nr:type II CAAX endopeptidase family protein [Planctomycetota bacterium]
METRDPGPLRTIRLLAAISLCRWINRMGARFRRRGSPKPGEPRRATARKERGGGAWLFLAGLMFLLSGLNISLQFLMRLSQGLQGAAGGESVHRQLWGLEIGFPWGGVLVQSAGAVLTLLACCQLWLSLGTGNQDLGRLEWSLEWLFTFPVPAGRLFLAKVCEYAIVNPFGWFMIFPFLLTAFWMGGHAAWAIPEAVGATLAIGFVVGSLRLTAETWLRMRLSIDRLKNVQAGCTLVGTVLWLGVLWLAMAQPVPAVFLEMAPRLPAGALWNPFSVGILLVDPGMGRLSPAGTLLAYAVLFPLASSAVCRFLVREGLLTSSGTFQGSRHPVVSGNERRTIFHGILAKDLRLLFRDRNFLVGTLVVPVLVFAFQAVLYPNLLRGATGDFRHAATLAYGLGAYILMSSAFHVLTIEGQSLWLLYTFPRELHRILIEKTAVWAAMALLYASIALGVTASLSSGLDWGALSLAVTALVGVVLAAFTAAALGTLAVDPLQPDVQRKIRAEVVYLYMLLSGMFGYALYGPSPWLRVVQVVLSTLLVLALWQKVRDRLPYLLDPTETPPPRIALSDGLIAVLAFFVLQGLIGAAASKASFGPWLIVSYAGAGAAVVLLSLYVFWRLRVPGLLEAVGFRSSRGSVGRALILGPMAGLSAAVAGIAYLIAIQKLNILKPFVDEEVKASERLRQGGFGWIALLAVVAAPLFEEYLFRGLVFKGMRRSMKPAVAVLASAAVFAIVHPPLSFIPVFGLGVGAALAFEGSGLLLSPILAHVVYNASMVFLTR